MLYMDKGTKNHTISRNLL